jgi:hypothetical protein
MPEEEKKIFQDKTDPPINPLIEVMNELSSNELREESER